MNVIKRALLILMLALAVVPAMSQTKFEHDGYSTPKRSEKLSQLSNADLWDRANTAYANENYIAAERMYGEILNRGVQSANLYYNLGNVNYKRGQIGASLLNYYKSQRLNPSDEDVQHNIDVVSLGVKDNITPMPRLFLLEWNRRLSTMLNVNGWSVVSLVAFGMILLSVMFYLLAGRLSVRRVGFASAVLSLLVFVVSTIYAMEARRTVLNPDEAVVMTSSLTVTSAPSRSSTELFILHEGTKLRVDSRVDGWCQIMLDDGKKGWVQQDKIAVI